MTVRMDLKNVCAALCAKGHPQLWFQAEPDPGFPVSLSILRADAVELAWWDHASRSWILGSAADHPLNSGTALRHPTGELLTPAAIGMYQMAYTC